METKEMKIVAPDGYEIDKENSTLDCIKFKSIKNKLTYEDVAKNLFDYKKLYHIHGDGKIYEFIAVDEGAINPINCTSQKQAEKLLAINQLMNVAKYLNGDWKPNWDKVDEKKYFIYTCPRDCYISVKSATVHMSDIVYFKSEELAQQAIDILGEETIKLALSTDW